MRGKFRNSGPFQATLRPSRTWIRMRQQLPARDIPVAVYLFQPFQKWVDGPIGATERSRVYSHVMDVLADQGHPEFASPTH